MSIAPPIPPARRASARALAAICVPILLSVSLAACGGDDSSASSADETPAPTDSTNTADVTQLNGEWPLTGEPLDGDLPDHPVLVTKIDNTSSSAPQVGLDSADMVVEELVEGGLTRLAVFYYSDIPGEVGPVRSMRASDIGIVKPANATLVASGGAPKTVRLLKNADITTRTEGSPGFYRKAGRTAPYDLFTKLSAAADKPGSKWKAPTDPYLPFGDDSDFSGDIPVTSIDAMFSAGHTTSWKYTEDGWTRPGSYAAAGDDFAADNVLLLQVKVGDAGYKDPAGNPVPETKFYGKGSGVLVHGDHAMKVEWKKDTKADGLTLRTPAGKDVSVPAGHTWIELVPKDTGKVSLGK